MCGLFDVVFFQIMIMLSMNILHLIFSSFGIFLYHHLFCFLCGAFVVFGCVQWVLSPFITFVSYVMLLVLVTFSWPKSWFLFLFVMCCTDNFFFSTNILFFFYFFLFSSSKVFIPVTGFFFLWLVFFVHLLHLYLSFFINCLSRRNNMTAD